MTPGSIIRYILIFIGLLLLQIVVIDGINLGRYATPILYVMFVMLWPVNTKPWITLVVCFTGGLLADIFSMTGGMHAFSMVFTAYARHYLMPIFISKDQSEKAFEPNLFNMGYRLFFFYALSLAFVYHLVFTLMDVASLHYFFITMGIVLTSTLLAVVMIFLIQLLFYRIRPIEE